MKKRVIFGIVIVALSLPVAFFSGTPVLPVVMSVLSVISVYELSVCTGLKTHPAYTAPAYLAAAGGPFAVRYAGIDVFLSCSAAVVSVLVIWWAVCMTFSREKHEGEHHSLQKTERPDVGSVSAFAVFSIYTVFGFSYMVFIRDFNEYGVWLLPAIFIAAWLTDVFAYFTGFLIGKHKLCPAVSPKKTVEGAVGGVILSTAALLLYGFIVGKILPDASVPRPFALIVSGVFGSAVAQLGDLMLSALKRHFGIKDFGKLIPGHGGILDRFDSVLAVSTAFFIICVVSIYVRIF